MKEKSRGSFRKSIETFASDTTVHGVALIAGTNRSTPTRIFWTFAFVCSTTLFILSAHVVYKKWRFDPDIAVKMSQKRLSDIPMPAVTICPRLFAKRGLANFTAFIMNHLGTLIKAANMTQDEANYLLANMHVCSPSSLGLASILAPRRTEENIVRLLEDSSLRPRELFSQCFIKGHRSSCSRVFNRVLTRRGMCFSLNMQGFATLFNRDVISKDFHSYQRTNIARSPNLKHKYGHETIDDNSEVARWSLEKGFSGDHDANEVPVSAERNHHTSITVALDYNNSFNLCWGQQSFGYWLHLPNEIPTPFHHEHKISFNEMEAIVVTARMYKADDSLCSHSPETRGCYFEGERRLRYFRSYTKAHCEFECLSNFTLETCGCVSFAMPRDDSIKVCEDVRARCYLNAFVNFPNQSALNNFIAPCGCLRPCSDIKYEIAFKESTKLETDKSIHKMWGFFAAQFDFDLKYFFLVFFKVHLRWFTIAFRDL
jgi:amiloride-sensitive sodium channel